MTDQLVVPKRAYQRIDKGSLPHGMRQIQQGKNVYGWAPVQKINKGGGKKKNARILVLEDMLLVTTSTKNGDIMNRALKLGDIEKMAIAETGKGYQVALIPYTQCPDPGVMLGLLRAHSQDATEILRILNYCRSTFYGVEIPVQRVSREYLKNMLQSQVFEGNSRAPHRENYRAWSHRQQVVPVRPRAPTPDLSSLRTFTIQLNDHNEAIGVTMESVNGVVKAKELTPGSAAARAGIPQGVFIYTVQGKKVSNIVEVRDEVVAAKQAQFAIARPELQVQCYGNGIQGAADTNTFSVSPAPVEKFVPLAVPSSSLQQPPSQVSQKSSTKSNRIETPIAAIAPPPPEAGDQVFPTVQEMNQKKSSYSGSSYDSDDDSNASSFQRADDYLPPTISFHDKTNNRIEFRREDHGLGEYVNGYRVGRAKLLVWFPLKRFLHDQNGKGGHIPKEDVHVLRRLKRFSEEAKVPLRIEGQDLVVEFTTISGDTMRYVPELGEIGEFINGVRCGTAITMTYNPISGTVTDQLGAGCKIPDKWLHGILSKLAVLCDACDVEHNIKPEVLAMIARNASQKHVPQEPQSPPPSDVNRQKELQKVEDELAIEEAKATSLEKRRSELERLEQELDKREHHIRDFEASPAGMFQKLQLCFSSQFPNDAEIIKLLGDVVSSFYWFDLCRTFEDSSLDLPTMLYNSLQPVSFSEAAKLLATKNIELEPPRSAEKKRGSFRNSIPHPEALTVMEDIEPQQMSSKGSVPFRKVMTPSLHTYSAPIPATALSVAPVAVPSFSTPNFFHDHYRQPLRAPLPFNTSSAAVFNTQLNAVDVDTVSAMAPIRPLGTIQNPPATWAETAIKRLEEAHEILVQSSPQREGSNFNKKESSEGLSALQSDTASHDLDSDTPKAAPWKHRPGGSAWDIL